MTRDEYVRKAAERLRDLNAAPSGHGHGHVRPRPDGVKARCGGPGLCAECSREAAAVTADRPVSAPDTVTDDMVRTYCAAHDAYFAGPPSEDNDPDSGVRAGLDAVVPLIRAQVAAELGRTCQQTDRVFLVDGDHVHECKREVGHRSPKHRCACGCEWWLREPEADLAARIAAVLGQFDWRYDYDAADIERAARAVARELNGDAQ